MSISNFKNPEFDMNHSDIRADLGGSGGFTIIETLVAITVLMIAVSGPLVVASKGLTAALYARDQVIASFLAQESMEAIKNTRDKNISVGLWLDDIDDDDLACNSKDDTCDISTISSTGSLYRQNCGTIGCPILYDDTSGYGANVPSGEATIFSRRYYLDGPNCDDAAIFQECTVHVIVTWNEGTVPYEVELSSELVNRQ